MKVREGSPAGHKRHATWHLGEKGLDLLGVGGVVQNDQGGGIGQPFTVGRGARGHAVRNLLTRDTEQAQESIEDGARVGWRLSRIRVKPPQIDKKDPDVV